MEAPVAPSPAAPESPPHSEVMAFLRPGLRHLIADGVYSQVMGVLTGGAFLVALALLLGASNAVIGLIAAIPSLAQLLQVPAIYVVNRIRRRRLISVVGSGVGRLFLLCVCFLPFFTPASWRIPLLLIALSVYFGLGAFSACAFNSWMRDLMPMQIMGAVFGRRMAIGTAIGAGLSLAAGFGVDFAYTRFGDARPVYSILFAVGGIFGLVGVCSLARIPEPAMRPPSTQGLLKLLGEPILHENYRKLLIFLGWWNAAVNMAAPFFVVYMLKQIGLSMGYVLSLAVLSQLVNAAFFRIWGRIADRFTNKSVLAVAGPLFIFSFLIWPFTTMPDPYFLTLPMLIAIHVLAGISTAGVNLCAGNIAIKAAPYGEATQYLAVNAFVSGVAATIAPILAGLAADWFDLNHVRITLDWTSTNAAGETRTWGLPAVDLVGLDFVFLIAFIVGLYAIHRLLAVKEEGEVEEEIVVQELYAEVRKAVANVSNVAGLRHLTYFPYAVLQYLRGKKTSVSEDDLRSL